MNDERKALFEYLARYQQDQTSSYDVDIAISELMDALVEEAKAEVE